ncbi:rhomboid family intramembrane serine protease [Thaumasiovibrio sp. DFM-14]|uniref:rhomboid family intramembrane serine protease n=1 Tax=Thaumasiovibrio sp. DFM-14 TaxID=3384792 RepID=UPI0039A360C8
MQKHVKYLGVFGGGLLALTALNVVYGGGLSHWGILPRQLSGLTGIVFAPVLHASWSHFFGNILSFYVLSFFLFQFGAARYYRVLFVSWILTGFAVWLFARAHYHIGLSGVIYSLWAYLLVYGVLRKSIKSAAIALVVVLIYGSFIWGVFPAQRWMSFESHLFGALIGGYFGFFYARRDKCRADKVVG